MCSGAEALGHPPGDMLPPSTPLARTPRLRTPTSWLEDQLMITEAAMLHLCVAGEENCYTRFEKVSSCSRVNGSGRKGSPLRRAAPACR